MKLFYSMHSDLHGCSNRSLILWLVKLNAFKKRSNKQRAEYLQKQDDILSRLKPERATRPIPKRRRPLYATATRPIPKRRRPLYAIATRPIPKRRRPLYATATTQILNLSYLLKGSDIKRTSRRTVLLKGSDIKRTSRRTALLKAEIRGQFSCH